MQEEGKKKKQEQMRVRMKMKLVGEIIIRMMRGVEKREKIRGDDDGIGC